MTESRPDVIGRGLLGALIAAALLSSATGGCRLPINDPVKLPTPSPSATPTVLPTPTPTAQPTLPPPSCAPVPAEGEVHEGGPYQFGDDIREAITAAYRKAGGTEEMISGPSRPGDWRAFVVLVAAELEARGYCASYDYQHGEEGGRASEMGARKGTRVEFFQFETSAGRVRTPPGAMRSWAAPACCEGQAVPQ